MLVMTWKILFGKVKVKMHNFSHMPTLAIILVVIVLNFVPTSCVSLHTARKIFIFLLTYLLTHSLSIAGSTHASSFLLNALLNPCLPLFKILVA